MELKFERTGGPYCDCSADYDAILPSEGCSIKQFFDWILKNKSEQEGRFKIMTGVMSWVEYSFSKGKIDSQCYVKNGKRLELTSEHDYTKRKVKEAKSRGTKEKMDYKIYLFYK